MPGVYTHNVIFRSALDLVSKSKTRTYLNRSIETLFSSPDHMKAGLFGAMGPNIFDYSEFISRGSVYGNDISFYLHDTGSPSFLAAMIETVSRCRDSRNEWASVQRAYLMGYVSHLISDAMVHPYVFYHSGFPSAYSRKEIEYYREANLFFQYNIDNYFIFKDENSKELDLNVEDMLPVYYERRREYLWPSIKVLLLSTLKKDNPDLFSEYFKNIGVIDGDIGWIRGVDNIPQRIRLSVRMKRTEDQRKKRLIQKLKDSAPVYSDFLVPFPPSKRVDEDALNLHQGRWQYPADRRGFRYDSVLHIIKASVEAIAETWIELESMVFGKDKFDLSEILQLNCYTGETGVSYRDMKIKDPVKLRF